MIIIIINKKKICLFLFRDYGFISHMHSIMGAQGRNCAYQIQTLDYSYYTVYNVNFYKCVCIVPSAVQGGTRVYGASYTQIA